MTLSELLRDARRQSGSLVSQVTDDWLQGRSAFGGLQGAFCVEAMRTLVDPSFPLRTFQMTFIAPIGAGECTTLASVLRAGKNTMHVEARIVGGQETLAHAIGVFGHARESIVKRDPPAAPAKKKGMHLPYVPNLTPNFFQHFDVSLIDGALPFSNRHVHRNVFELGMKESVVATEAHLLALADFVPPVALSWLPKPTPGSSMTWMLEFLDPDFAQQPVSGWLLDAEMIAARDGYTSQSTTLWSPAGVPTLLSRQSMVVFG
ncbi:MAG TPA: thioesterase family protein [Rudaea sp.]|nr:thioesterase family protein [Rudaea sp.]